MKRESADNILADEAGLAVLPSLTPLLLEWFQANGRKHLPWRKNHQAYRVWVSEIMLQQTRVETVIPYFERFMKELPTIQSLAQVSDARLMKLWEGLGYYSRAKNLKKAAGVLVEEYHGEMPSSYGELLSLPGIGPYTAGAIASISFGIPVPAVDGNVYRVLSRLLDSEADINAGAVQKQFYQAAQTMVPSKYPGNFNEAMMDLGATICLPGKNPHCEKCPFNEVCLGFERDTAGDLPYKSPKKKRKIEERTVFVIHQNGRYLLCQRPDKGLLAGQWELPNEEGHLPAPATKKRLESLGCKILSMSSLPASKHIFSHIEWHMIGYAVEAKWLQIPERSWWVSPEELAEAVALPSAFSAYRPYIK